MFDKDRLVDSGFEYDKTTNSELQLLEYYDKIENLILKHKVSFIVAHAIDYQRLDRTKSLKFTKTRTILRLLCAKHNVSYNEVDTTNFEIYFFGDNKKGKELAQEKINVINNVFDLNLRYDEDNLFNQGQVLADTLVLGTAFTQDKIKTRQKVTI